MPKNVRVACDVGGTFTDLAYYTIDEETGVVQDIKTGKVPSTPPNFEEGVLNSLKKGNFKISEIDTMLAHGTTVVINAISERKGVKTGLITTKGFRDILEIARGDRPDFFNLKYKKPKPFIPRHLRRVITERIDYHGEVLTPINLDELSDIIKYFKKEEVEAIGVCLLHSYANPKHEKKIVSEIKKRWSEVYVIASHTITREWREYERTNTTVLSSYVQPIVDNYVTKLENKLKEKDFSSSLYIMKSNGGVDTAEKAKESPITMIESGPASGMLGAAMLGQLIDEPNVIALDIGGTTAKCSLIDDNQIQITTKYMIERSKRSSGYPIMTPVVDITEIGNGGGSIAWIDDYNKMHVGPESAGAVPGPVAYGQGGKEPTTADANLLLKRINPEYFFGGDINADMKKVRKAMMKPADKLGLNIQQMARGIIRIANNNMANALKLVSINRGYDPRDFTMVAFGGGGPLHAAFLAKELNIPKVIIPSHAAVFSAWGMLRSDLKRDFILTRPTKLEQDNISTIIDNVNEMEEEALLSFKSDGFSSDQVRFEWKADMRYEGQEHTIRVSLPEESLTKAHLNKIINRFHLDYKKEYTYNLDSSIELISYNLSAFADIKQPKLPKITTKNKDKKVSPEGYREVDYGEFGVHEAKIFKREYLNANSYIEGPAVIEEHSTTTVVLPEQTVKVDEFGNLSIKI